MNPALKNIEAALTEHFGWSANAALRKKINAAVEIKAERLRVAPEDYCRIASTSPSEMLSLVEEISLGETRFFREPHQFDFLRSMALPNLIKSRLQDGRLSIWSAACSTGEEAYSLAIAFDQIKPSYIQLQTEVFATDVRNRALLEASQACYRRNSLRDVDAQTLERYFERSAETAEQIDETFTVIAGIRRLVTFRRVNLLEGVFWRGVANRFDLIVCSNLIAFLSNQVARTMVTNLANSLRRGGYLMVAPDEESLVVSPQLSQVKGNPSFFQKVG